MPGRRAPRLGLGVLLAVLAVVPVGCRPQANAKVSWTEFELPPALAHAEVESAQGLPGGDVLVAGAVRTKAGSPSPVLWRGDLRTGTWRQYSMHPTDIDGENARLVAVAGRERSDIGVLGFAIGFAHGNARPVLWKESGPSTLEESRLERELFGGPRGMTVRALAASELGFFATGTWSNRGTERQVAQVWHAAQLPDWERLGDEPSRLSAPGEQLWGEDIVATGKRVVMVGWAEYHARGGVEDPMDAAAWSSADGTTFVRSDDLRSPGRQSMHFVEAVPTGFLAVGEADGAVVTWFSADGVAWGRPSPVVPHARATTTATSGSIVYIATSDADGSKLWTVGTATRELPLPESFGKKDSPVLTVAGDRLLVLGNGEHRHGWTRRTSA
jgi:hypothetical protein